MSVIEAEPSIQVDLDRARLGLGGALSVASAHGRETMLPDYLEAVQAQFAASEPALARDKAVGMIASEMGLLQAFMIPPPAEAYSDDFIDDLLGHHETILAKETAREQLAAVERIAYAARLTFVDLIEGLW